MKSAMKRATVYFDSQIHRVLRLKAAETDRSISDLVNDAVKMSLAEDAEDLAAFKERAREPNLVFEDVLRDLRKRGKL
jgi:predicted oxidoreductase (fatty acid repression mutant protein)